MRNKNGIFFVQTSNPTLQLKDVITHYNLQKDIRPFSRCIECNCLLKSVKKESIRDNVPYFTFKNFDEFAQCPNCERVYWKGSHYKRMLQEIEDILR